MDGAHKRTLEKALGIVVKKERLAAALDVPMQDLEAYLAGEKPLPAARVPDRSGHRYIDEAAVAADEKCALWVESGHQFTPLEFPLYGALG